MGHSPATFYTASEPTGNDKPLYLKLAMGKPRPTGTQNPLEKNILNQIIREAIQILK